MNFVSFVAIPINLVILLFARFPSEPVGYFQDLDNLPLEEESVLI